MKRKTDLCNYKIEYSGKKYTIDLYGAEDYNFRNGLWDLSTKCADNVINILDDCLFFDTDEQSDLVKTTVCDTVYSLIKFHMLRQLNKQLNSANSALKKQNEM